MNNRHPGDTSQGAPRQKKTYAKPEIRQVSLRPEEAVLGNCKSSTTSTGPGGTCQTGLGSCHTVSS
jgi:hypothetical protein